MSNSELGLNLAGMTQLSAPNAGERLRSVLDAIKTFDALRADTPTDEEFRRAHKFTKQTFAEALTEFLETLDEDQIAKLALRLQESSKNEC